MQVLLYAEVGEHLRGIALCLPSIHLSKLLLKLCGTVAVGLRHLRLGIEGLALLHVLPQRGMAHEHRVEHAVSIVLEVVLFQHREPLTRAELHAAFVGLKVAADGTEERGLASAVGTDYSVNVAGGELDVYIFIKNSFAKLDG